jgi:putative NIF3 family GTP cyclohydrolase 1 type 2
MLAGRFTKKNFMLTLKQIYNLAIQMGIKTDPRGKKRIKRILTLEKERFKDLKKDEQKEFDHERFTNPYSDTRILYGQPVKKVKRVLVGIDISVSEILLAEKLKEKRKPIDLIISHHPLGKALAGLDDVMHLQADLLASYGVPINVAESLLEKRIDEVARSVSPINHNRPVDAAKILDIPLISLHTPADNLVYDFVKKRISKENPETVEDVLKVLKKIPEYKEATLLGAGPRLFAGKPERRAGKIALTEITGGTEGSKDIYERLSQVGIGTIIGMHMKEEHREEAEKHHINVVIAGHIASDSLGLNLFLDELEKEGIEIVPCSGLIRVKRRAR